MAGPTWVKPDKKELEREYEVEVIKKHLDIGMTKDEFVKAALKAQTLKVTSSVDKGIAYRSWTSNKKSLLSLIKSYRSYPEFRNEKTLDNLYDRMENGQTMNMPIVIEFKNGMKRVMAGNTRMDVARHLGLDPVVLLVKVNV